MVPIVLPHTNEQGAMIPVMCLSVSPAGNLIAAGCSDGAVRVWAYGDADDDAAWGTGKHNTRRTGRDTIGRGEVFRREAPPPPASQIDSIAATNAAAAAAAVAASRSTASPRAAAAAGGAGGATAAGASGAELPPAAASALPSLSSPPPSPPPLPPPLWNPAASDNSAAAAPTGLDALAAAAVADRAGSTAARRAIGAGAQLASLSLDPSPVEASAAGGAGSAAGGVGAAGAVSEPLPTFGFGQAPQLPPASPDTGLRSKRPGGGANRRRGEREREQRGAAGSGGGASMGGLEVRLATKLFGE